MAWFKGFMLFDTRRHPSEMDASDGTIGAMLASQQWHTTVESFPPLAEDAAPA